MMNRKFVAILVATILLLGAGWAQAAPEKEPAQNKEPIKIGALFALSGPAAAIGMPTKLVAEMAVAKINKEGGINGRPLELVIGDTESDAAKAATIAKKFIYQDKVAAIIGPTRTDSGMAVKKIVEEACMPTFMTVGGDPVIMGGEKLGSFKYVFKSPQRSSIAVKKLYSYLKSKNIKTIGLLTATDGFGKDGLKWLEKLAPEYGLEIVAKESFGPQDTDMTAQLTKIKNAKPQAIICWTIGPAGAIVSKSAGSQIHRTGGQGRGRRPHALHQTLGGKRTAGQRPPETRHPGVHPPV
jgi:branched-chain amino acid transport system substrate-binding protein